jgi:hypothetical protein
VLLLAARPGQAVATCVQHVHMGQSLVRVTLTLHNPWLWSPQHIQ